MEQNKHKGRQSKELTPEQLQKRKKMIIFPLMFGVFALAMYFIFIPSSTSEQEQKGLNTDLPIPQNEIMGDKKTAYELELFDKKKRERQMLSLENYGIDPDTVKNEIPSRKVGGTTSRKAPQSSIHTSANAYKSMNQDLNNFYNQPQENSREKEMEKKIEKLQADLDEKNSKDNLVDEQLKIMEESYKMAAKYMPSVQGQTQPVAMPQQNIATAQNSPPQKIKKFISVFKLNNNEVSALKQHINDSAFMERYSKPVNIGFYTAGINKNGDIDRNTIKACVHSDQTIISGQNVKLRLLEPIRAGELIIPKHDVITGIATIQSERLNITIHSLEYLGKIIPVEISMYDMDGQRGLFIPGSAEVNAIKEITASMGRDAGTSINISQGTTAGQQLAADVGRSVIQGTSQYISKKMRTTKVRLKTGHRLLLMPNN